MLGSEARDPAFQTGMKEGTVQRFDRLAEHLRTDGLSSG
jgi:hypothetical protein